MMAFELVDKLARLGVPHPRDLVMAAGYEKAAIGAERDALEIVRMANHLHALAIHNAPHMHLFVVVTGGEESAAWANGQRSNAVGVPRKHLETRATRRIPQAHDSILPSCSKQRGARHKRDAKHRGNMAA